MENKALSGSLSKEARAHNGRKWLLRLQMERGEAQFSWHPSKKKAEAELLRLLS